MNKKSFTASLFFIFYSLVMGICFAASEDKVNLIKESSNDSFINTPQNIAIKGSRAQQLIFLSKR